MATSTYIYALLLEKDRYYIGCTTNVQKRFQEHKNGQGSSWTHRYSPLKVIEQKLGNFTDENILTKQYMIKYGIRYVRGGSYSNIYLDKHTKKVLEREICSIRGACYMCKKIGHYVRECPNKPCIRCGLRGHPTEKCKSIYCYRCGRTSHMVEKCYAKTHFHNKSMKNCYRCGRKDHQKTECDQKTDIFGVEILLDVNITMVGRFTSWIKSWY